MIDLEALTARATPIVLAPITTKLGAGLYALLGGRDDAVVVLLDVIAGRARPRGGLVRVLGGSPTDADVRKLIAHVPLEVALPDAMRVDEALWIAAEIRGESSSDAALRLGALGLSTLAERSVRSLAPDEARGVAMAEAVTSSAKVILIEEPFTSIDPRAAAALGGVLRARARDGVCILFSTASVRDALALADEVLTFDRGALVRRAAATDPLATTGPRGAALRAVVSDVRKLLSALAGEEAYDAVEVEPGSIVLRGRDPIALASAIARAVAQSGVTLTALVADVAPLSELRAAIAGDAAGAYRAATERARVVAPPSEVAAHEMPAKREGIA